MGHHNRRFFVNFLTYTTLGLTYYLFLLWINGALLSNPFYNLENIGQLSFVASLALCLFLFGAFHWLLMLKGQTTLEMCFPDKNYTPSGRWCDNFKVTYGT